MSKETLLSVSVFKEPVQDFSFISQLLIKDEVCKIAHDSLHQSPQMLKVAAVVGKTKLEMICYAFVERVFTGFEEET